MNDLNSHTKQELIDEILLLRKQLDSAQIEQVEKELLPNETWLRTLYKNVNEVIFYLDVEKEEKFRFQSVNPAFLKTTGLKASQVVGKLVDEVIPEPSLSLVLSHYKKAIQSRKPVQWEETTFYPTGQKVGDINIKPLFDANGVCTNLIGTAYDITKRKEVEEKIKRSEAKFRRLSDANIVGIAFWNASGDIIDANDEFLRMVGYDRNDLISGRMDWKNMTPPEYKEVDRKGIEELTATGVMTSFEKEYICKDGSRVAVLLGAAMLEDSSGSGIAFILDLTEHKKAQLAQKNSEERFRLLFENATVPIWLEDFSEVKKRFDELKKKGINDFGKHFKEHPEEVDNLADLVKVLDVNQKSVEFYKAKDKNSLVKDLPSYFIDESLHVFRDELIALANGETAFEGEISILTPLGDKHHLIVSLSVPSEYSDTLEHVLVSFLDITERKNIEEAIHESRARLIVAQQIARMGDFRWDLTSNEIEFSEGLQDLLQYDKLDRITYKKLNQEIHHPEDLKKVTKWLDSCIQSDQGRLSPFEYRVLRGDGKVLYVRTMGVVERIRGKPMKVIATVLDITKQKKVEIELKESESRYHRALEATSDAIWDWNLQTNERYFSSRWFKLLGYEPNEFEWTAEKWQELTHPEDFEKSSETVIEAVLHGKGYSQEFRIKAKDGTWRWVLARGEITDRDETGKAVRMSGTNSDITVRKLAEEALQHNEEIFNHFMEHSPIFVFFKDKNVKSLRLSKNFEELLGKPIAELLGKNMDDLFTSDFAKKIVEDDIKVMREGKNLEIEEEYNDRIYSTIKFPIVIDGKPEYLAGYTIDITNRKKAEIQLMESERKLSTLLGNLPGIAYRCEHSPAWTMEYISEGCKELTGYKPNELIGSQLIAFGDIIHPEDKEKVWKLIDKAVKKGKQFELEYRIIRKNNEIRWVWERGSLAHNGKSPRKVLEGFISNITQRKKAEALLYEKENFLKSLLNAIPIPVFYKDRAGRYIGFNNAFVSFFGILPKERIGKTVFDHNPPDLAKIYHDQDMLLINKGGEQRYEAQVEDTNGIRHEVIFNKAVFTDNEGNINGMIGAILDITDLKKAENELLQRNKDLFRAKEYVEESEKRLKEAQSMAKLGNWELDLKTDQFNWSDEMYRIFDVYPTKFKGTYEAFLETIHPDDKDIVIQTYLSHLNNKRPFEIDFRILLPNALSKHLLQKCYSEFNKEGRAIKSFGTVQDITTLKQVEEKLLKLNRELELRVFERTAEIKKLSEAVIHSPAIVMITDPDGTIEYVNPKFTEITGYTFDEITGQNPRVLNAGFHEQKYFTKLWKTIKSDKVWQGELCNKKKNGEIFWEHTSISSIKAKDNKITHFVAVKEDITLRKQMEEELTKAKEEAEVANKTKSEFLANMSHEIRTPMNAVLGFADLLSNMVNDKLQKSYLDSIKSSGKSLLTLINDILDLSKIEAGKLELQYSYVDLHDVFSELKNIFSLASKEKGLKFIVDIESNFPLLIQIDEIRLRQIIINLLSNAFKFTTKGQVSLTAKAIKIVKNGNNNFCDLHIDVKDTGIGITEDSKAKIFDSFNQQEGQSTKKYGGTGLGLAISQRLVNLMNGIINLQSKLNKGSNFSIIFKNVKYTDDKSEKREYSKISISSIEFFGSSILIVDDTADNRKYLAGVLRNYNLDVIQASDGREALEVLKHRKPDLIITDLRMPGINGFQLMKKLQRNEDSKKIPVIATSASAMKNSVEKVKKASFSGFIIKPFQTKELLMELIKHIPYENKDKKDVELLSKEKISINDIKNPEGFLNQLAELNTVYYPLKEQQAMQDVEFFANKCILLSKKFDVEVLFDYGDKLSNAVKNFDIELMLTLINKFEELKENLRKLIKKNDNRLP